MKKVVILGAGMAGFGASHFLKENSIESVVYEKHKYYGGNSTSFTKEGFTFDTGPHISFTKNELIQKLFAKSVKDQYNALKVEVNNFWKSYWVKHPAQVNLFGLPTDLVADILEEFIENSKKDNSEKEELKTFKEWLYASFGKTFAENFPMKYTRKFHTTEAENMSVDWVGPRLYQPKMREIILGALTPKTEDVHYISHFRYPKEGGYISYLNDFRNTANLELEHELIELDPVAKLVKFKNNEIANYDYLVSSIPLPKLIPLIKNVPKTVLEASEKLACSKCVIVNLGINRPDISKAIWTYFYDEDIIFTRLSFPHMQSENNVPDGCGSVQAEIYFSDKYKPLEKKPEAFIDRTINDLIKCGLFKESDEILYKEARLIPFANVIFDLDRKENLQIVHDYLDKIGVRYCGRYGMWGYQWTDESFVSGMDVAKEIINEIKSN